MKKKSINMIRIFMLSFVLMLVTNIKAQTPKGTVIGCVKDANGNPLAGASIKVEETKAGASADNAGSYSISLNAGTYHLTFAYVGHTQQNVTITIIANAVTTQDILLADATTVQEGVVVVGSRNPKRTATESPVPVDVIPLRQIANQVGQLDLAQLLNYLAPSFNSVRQALGDGTDHIDPAQLRGLGPDQVLVLVNGKRYHQSSLVNVNGTVNKGTVGTDLNSIPASSVERIEV